jgi:hypothetical protein
MDFENSELNKFYNGLLQDIRTTLETEEEGGNSEQIFTQFAVELLAEAGETENVIVAYDEKGLGTKNQHKINAYSISENYETIDLFITVFKGLYEISSIYKADIDKAATRIINFFRKGTYKQYVNEIEESSPIFQFVYTLAQSTELKENLVRVNAIILTDGIYSGKIPENQVISGYNIYFRVIDLNYLYNITEKSHIPIELDFEADGYEIPCIEAPSENAEYKSYLAIIPGIALANIYEKFGSRLLEQNVRSFLQFSGKINKGIRNTILKEPHMFLAFNNGIAATAEKLEFSQISNGKGLIISKVNDLQIVNGGQTTASIYHTYKKDKADISNIFVQVKLSVVNNKENFSTIVSRIAEYANTQNKVSVADLSSNKPYHIEFEKLSRSIYTPHSDKNTIQTKWFYERARGQYKNARIKEGFTKAKERIFDLKNPKIQMFTKEELAKYINAYQEICDGKKILIGPHFVVRGNQKNYIQFVNYNLEKKLNNIYFEDSITKAIIFKSAEKVYGIKPNSIGDMRYVTVPYTISLLNLLTENQLDLYKIWKNQVISENLKGLFYKMMVEIEAYIKETAPGGLYGEWAKKEDCWIKVKENSFTFDLSSIKQDMIDKRNQQKRNVISDDETENQIIQEQLETIKSITYEGWKKIEKYGYDTKNLSDFQINIAFNLAGRIRNKTKISETERNTALKIIEIIIDKTPEILFEIDELEENNSDKTDTKKTEIDLELVKRMVDWDRKHRKLEDYKFAFMNNIVLGKAQLTDYNKKLCQYNYEKLKKFGFE